MESQNLNLCLDSLKRDSKVKLYSLCLIGATNPQCKKIAFSPLLNDVYLLNRCYLRNDGKYFKSVRLSQIGAANTRYAYNTTDVYYFLCVRYFYISYPIIDTISHNRNGSRIHQQLYIINFHQQLIRIQYCKAMQ